MKLISSKKIKLALISAVLLAGFIFVKTARAVELNINTIDSLPSVTQAAEQNPALPADNVPSQAPETLSSPTVEQTTNQDNSASSANVKGNVISDGLSKFGQYLNLSNADPRTIAAKLISSALGLIGIIFLVMILLSGLKFMLSGGQKEKTDEAKKTFLNAIIGLIIMLMAYGIVTFVFSALDKATG